ncbi:MAG: hypothetical protein IJ011_04445 [Clostridia bacterium]|nr:hypothetical protein [Clostridia bacterium]
MKKVLAGILIVSFLFAFCGCSKERTNISDYQYMYDGIVKDWNKLASPSAERESLLGFGEYLYNSQLIFFPRETPSTLNEFYFHWTPGIDVDGYAIYFTCVLDENNYIAFVDGLRNFEVSNGTETKKLFYDTEHFSCPTYIAQWTEVEEKWEVLEYIMLDEAKRTVVFIYTMSEIEFIEEHSSYIVTPTEFHFLEGDFSIYKDFDNCTYDISFLEYLN